MRFYFPKMGAACPRARRLGKFGGLVNVSSRRPATFRRHHRTIITPTAAGYFTKSRCGSEAFRRASGTTGKEVFVSACPAFSRTTGAKAIRIKKLPHACPAFSRTTGAKPAAQGAISHSRARFATSTKRECTTVLDLFGAGARHAPAK